MDVQDRRLFLGRRAGSQCGEGCEGAAIFVSQIKLGIRNEVVPQLLLLATEGAARRAEGGRTGGGRGKSLSLAATAAKRSGTEPGEDGERSGKDECAQGIGEEGSKGERARARKTRPRKTKGGAIG